MKLEDKTKLDWATRLLLVAIAALILGGDLVYNHFAYGDAWCAVKRCVSVENIKS